MEIFNGGTTAVSLSGWSVQYASAAGTSWQVTALSGSIGPGRYYLVQQASGGAAGAALPPAEATGTTNLSATAGKVALVNSASALSGACPSGETIADLVGYGSSASCSEANPAPAPSAATSLRRKGEGCTDSDNNASDLSTGAPGPRNGASPAKDCAAAAGAHEETGAGFFSIEGPPPSVFVFDWVEFFSARRPSGGSTRWRTGAAACGPRGTPCGLPRPRGAWP